MSLILQLSVECTVKNIVIFNNYEGDSKLAKNYIYTKKRTVLHFVIYALQAFFLLFLNNSHNVTGQFLFGRTLSRIKSPFHRLSAYYIRERLLSVTQRPGMLLRACQKVNYGNYSQRN